MRRAFIIAAVIGLLLTKPEIGAAKEPGVIAINGPGIQAAILVRPGDGADRALLESMFDHFSEPLQAPKGLGEGYTLTMVIHHDGQSPDEWRVFYYPVADGEGYMHIPYDGSRPDQPAGWYQARPGVKSRFSALLIRHGLDLNLISRSQEGPDSLGGPPFDGSGRPAEIANRSPQAIQASGNREANAIPNLALFSTVALISLLGGAAWTYRRKGKPR